MKERFAALLLFFLALLTIWALIKKLPDAGKTYGTIESSSRDAATSSASSPALADEVIRLHILAASDSKKDQEIKLLVRDALLPYLSAATEVASSKEEALQLLSSQCDVLTEIANNTLHALGTDYSAHISIEQLYFPVRIYGSQTYLSADATIFPPGIYDSIQIVLGSGDGHNWWCLAYPSLCFIDATYEYVPKDSPLYKEKFATIKESSLKRLFCGTTETASAKDTEIDIFLEFKLWNLFTTKIKKFMVH